MKEFDVQRVESLMRYAEFLKDMEAPRKKIDRVIELIHEEVGGYVNPVNTTKLFSDSGIVHEEINSLHPDVEEMIHQKVMEQMIMSIEAKHDVEQFVSAVQGSDSK